MRGNPNYEVIKEPRGFIKCLEIFLAIFAFSCATGYRGNFSFHQNYVTNQGNHTIATSHLVEGSFKYPFDGSIRLQMVSNTTTVNYVEYPVEVNQRHSVEFFVVVGVFCFLYSLGMLVYYIWFELESESAPTTTISLPVIDFVVGGVWAFFWFVSACAQAAAENHIKDVTNMDQLFRTSPYCSAGFNITCSVFQNAKYATLTVSVLLGFLNVFVWCGNMWFLWKETPWHKGNNARAATVQQQQPTQHQPTPSAAPV